MIRWVSQRPLALFMLIVLASVATLPSLTNGFAFDDIFLVRDNPRVHDLLAPWTYARESYWLTHYCCAMYRPLTIWLLAIQWAIGDGTPLVFHIVSVVGYMLTVTVVFWLLRSAVEARAAWMGAAVFAVHPVHVEATGNIVGQAELWVGLAAVSALLLYVRFRRQGALPAPVQVAILGLVAVGSLAKEQAFVIPLLLVAAEFTFTGDRRPWADRLGQQRQLFLSVLLVLTVVFWIRWTVLSGLGGGPPFVVLRDATLGQRLLTVLGVVPEWVRLLLWPARLRADYGPPAHDVAVGFGAAQTAGILLLAGAAAAAIWSWRRARVLAFGILWIGIALLPVSNLFFTTGVLIAERTLYLPSVGVALGVAAVAGYVAAKERLPRAVQSAVGFALAGVIAAGALASGLRQRVWRDNESLFAATLRDAPENYRSYKYYGRHLVTEGAPEAAIPYFRHAIALYPRDPVVAEDLAQLLRVAGRCAEAVEVLDGVLRRLPNRSVARAKAFYCLLEIGEFDRARELASAGVALGDTAFVKLRSQADSLIRASESP